MRDDHEGRALRDAIRAADDVAFGESRSIFANSGVVRDRLETFNKRTAEVLYPPLDQPRKFRCDGYGDEIVYVSRLTEHKRQWLAIEAMAHTRTPVRLVVAGAPDSPADAERLGDLVRARGLQERVDIRVGWLSEEDKVSLFGSCLAAVYCPFDEDSYGYPSLEAHQSRKAVISTTDSGGVRELVVDGTNGFLCEPTPEAIATRFDELYEDRNRAQAMGDAGFGRIVELGISWEHVIGRLLS